MAAILFMHMVMPKGFGRGLWTMEDNPSKPGKEGPHNDRYCMEAYFAVVTVFNRSVPTTPSSMVI